MSSVCSIDEDGMKNAWTTYVLTSSASTSANAIRTGSSFQNDLRFPGMARSAPLPGPGSSLVTGSEPSGRPRAARPVLRRERRPSVARVLSVLARLDVAEECAALDQRGDVGRDHAFPGVVARGDPAQDVAAEDRQALGPVVVEVDEAAPSGEVVVQRLQLRLDLNVVDGLELLVRRGLQGVDVELQLVLEQPPEAFQDAAGEPGVVLLVEQVNQARHAHHDADPLAGALGDIGGQTVVVEVIADQYRHPARREQF